MKFDHNKHILTFENNEEFDNFRNYSKTYREFINTTYSDLTFNMENITKIKAIELFSIISLRLKYRDRKLIVMNTNREIIKQIKRLHIDLVII